MPRREPKVRAHKRILELIPFIGDLKLTSLKVVYFGGVGGFRGERAPLSFMMMRMNFLLTNFSIKSVI